MKLLVQSPTELPSLGQMTGYLLATGWSRSLSAGVERWAQFVQTIDGTTETLDVPLVLETQDFSRRMAEAIANLSSFEGRLSAELVRNIKASSVDILRLAITGAGLADGRVSLEAGPRIHNAARDMLLAAACAAVEAKPYFPSRKPNEASLLMKRAHFGQSEVGSYVMTLECSAVARVQTSLFEDDDSGQDTPMERRACVGLAHALHAVKGAIETSIAGQNVAAFENAVQRGVSANLCDSIREILEASAAESMSANFSFASCRPAALDIPRVTRFESGASIRVLREASEKLREQARFSDAEITGTIVGLESSNPQAGGLVAVNAILDGTPRRIKFQLESEEYQQAIAAHQNTRWLRCVGEISRSGNTWILENIHEFRILSDE